MEKKMIGQKSELIGTSILFVSEYVQYSGKF